MSKHESGRRPSITSTVLKSGPGSLRRGKASKLFSVAKPIRTKLGKFERSPGETVTAVAVSSDTTYFVATSMNKKAIVYSTADGSEVVTFALGAAPNAVVFLNKGEHTKIGVGTFASELHFFSIAQQKELHSIKCSDVGSVNCMSTCIRKCASGTSLDREVVRLCAGCQSGAIFIWRNVANEQ